MPRVNRTALLIPGREQVHQSLLTFAEEALERREVKVHRLWWSPPKDLSLPDLVPWVRDQVETALDDLALDDPVLVGKSLGSLAAPVAADRELAAIWLTPVLHEEPFISLYRKATRPRLFIGGTADQMWNGALAAELSPDVLEVPDADHGLFVPGPLARSGESHGLAGTAIEAFLDGSVFTA